MLNIDNYPGWTIAYGGNFEDVVLCRAFKSNGPGTYVDVGAGDPVEGSVTKNLYDLFGWTGVNVEPLNEFYQQLVEGRPNDVNIRAAVASHEGQITFHEVSGAPGRWLGTINDDVAQRYREQGTIVNDYLVPAVPLDSILRAHVTPGFDLLKIDVEGGEAETLASFNLDYWKPRVVLIEAIDPLDHTDSSKPWDTFLTSAGYELQLFDGVNHFYVRHNEPELANAIRVPANVLDKFIPEIFLRI